MRFAIFFFGILATSPSFASDSIDYRSGLHCNTQTQVFTLCPVTQSDEWSFQFYDVHGRIVAKSCVEKNHVLSCDLGDVGRHYDLFDFYIGKTYPGYEKAEPMITGFRFSSNVLSSPVLDQAFACFPLSEDLKKYCSK